MISRYLKTKNIISQIKPILNREELNKDNSDGFWYLHTYDHGNNFYYYESLFTEDELKSIVNIGQNLTPEEGTVGGNVTKEELERVRKSSISWFPVNPYTEWVYRKLTSCVLEMNEKYFKYDLDKIERLQFTRYQGNLKQFYKRHLDTNGWSIPPNRKLSFVLQLSDPSEYEGGDLLLHIAPNPIAVKKQKGLITFFPANTLHECTEVTAGNRFVLVGWVYGPPFK